PPGELGDRDPLPARSRHHDHHQCARLRSRSLRARRRLHRQVGRGRDRQALTRGLHTPASRAGRRLEADRPQRLLRVSRAVAHISARRLEATSRRIPDKPALVWDGGALTFGELDRRSRALADLLAGRGVKAGDRIALRIGNHWAFAVALLAGFKLGATVAPLEPLLKEDERAAILADLAPAAVVDEADAVDVGRSGSERFDRRSRISD